jgi:gas vesicle protein
MEGTMIRFLFGAVAGFAAGMAAATLTAGKTGDELRAEFDRFRAEVQKGDMEALGSHLEERFKELQSGLEQRLAAIADATKDMQAQAQDAAGTAAEAAGSMADDVSRSFQGGMDAAAEGAAGQ